jgi:hypothetical protein
VVEGLQHFRGIPRKRKAPRRKISPRVCQQTKEKLEFPTRRDCRRGLVFRVEVCEHNCRCIYSHTNLTISTLEIPWRRDVPSVERAMDFGLLVLGSSSFLVYASHFGAMGFAPHVHPKSVSLIPQLARSSRIPSVSNSVLGNICHLRRTVR